MIGIIPARGGSKGLPKKNIKDLNGKPLIAYTIEAAIASKLITKIIVNTDNPEIAEVALKYGAEVPFIRPAELATDDATSIDVLKHTIDWFKQNGENFDEFVLLQPTSPLRDHIDIDDAISLFHSKKADSVISCCKESHPVFWHKYLEEDGKLTSIFEDAKSRQNYRETYVPNGAIFVAKTKLLQTGNLYTDNTFGFEMERNKSIDIDTAEDFEYCQYLLKKNN